MDMLMKTTYALCAFERRCDAGSSTPYPPRPSSDSLDLGLSASKSYEQVVSVAQTQMASLSSLWGKAWEVGRSAAKEAVAQAGEMLTEERIQKVKDLGQAVAATATAASAIAAANLEALDAKLEARINKEGEIGSMSPEKEKQLEAVATTDVWDESEENTRKDSSDQPSPSALGSSSGEKASEVASIEEAPALVEAPQLVEAPP